MLASPADGSDGKSVSALTRACVMDLLDPRTRRVSQASVRLHGVRSCQISAAVDLVEKIRRGVYVKRVMQLSKSVDKQTPAFASSRSCVCIRWLREAARMSARYA